MHIIVNFYSALHTTIEPVSKMLILVRDLFVNSQDRPSGSGLFGVLRILFLNNVIDFFFTGEAHIHAITCR